MKTPYTYYKAVEVDESKLPHFELNTTTPPVYFTNTQKDKKKDNENSSPVKWFESYEGFRADPEQESEVPLSKPIDTNLTSYYELINKAIERSKQDTYEHGNELIRLGTTSNGQCTYGPSTFYKELDLQGSFWNTHVPETATSTNLTRKGFDKVWEGNYADVKSNKHVTNLKPGDLMISYGKKQNGKNSSHIAMWNGEKWVSDFIQKGPLVYPQERKGESGKSVEIFRLDPSKILKGEKGMKVDKKEKSEEDIAYEEFLLTCPNNIRYTDPKKYRMRRYWELHGKPKTFWDGLEKNMFSWDEKDKGFHSNSVAKNEKGEYEFMKYPDHPTTHMELEWFREGKVYKDGDQYLLVPEHGQQYDDWFNFKTNYDLVDPTDEEPFYKYVPKQIENDEKDIPKDEQGAKIIVIEKEVIEEPEEETDPLKCLLCQIMNAMGHRHHAFSELRPDKLTDIFGGNAEIVIELGGPEKAYNEDSFVEMIKDILPAISTSKKYSKEDIKEIRSKKAEHGTSMKRLLALMDDDKILKAFHGMQLFKSGGELHTEEEEVKSPKTIDIEIADKTYSVREAITNEEKAQGLNNSKELTEDEGMIFYWDEPQQVSMTMKNCNIPLLICFFDEDQECISVQKGEPLSKEPIICENVKFVVELHPSAPVKVGDELDLPGDDDEYVMQVLGSDGSIQMQLKGGERIFSRPNTKMLLKWSKQAYNSDNPSDYKRLGKLIFKYLDQQDNRDPEYVQLDSKND